MTTKTMIVKYASPADDPLKVPRPTYVKGDPDGPTLMLETTGGEGFLSGDKLIGFSHQAEAPETFGPEHWIETNLAMRHPELLASGTWWASFTDDSDGIYTVDEFAVESVEVLADEPDPSKPNHYYHDGLGDPATCTGDHNHPEPGDEPAINDEIREEAEAEFSSDLVLNLTLNTGADVRITVEYNDDGTSAVQSLRTFASEKYLFKLAAGLGLIQGVELVSDDEDEEF